MSTKNSIGYEYSNVKRYEQKKIYENSYGIETNKKMIRE